uniref:RNA-directed RNA polymerase n=1 Tax=Alternaria dianthicola umbra-like virus 2 TaxID=2992035 RepID=A0A9E7V6R8_9TOMB|nr:RNA-dependent RNA polymerase [Alternaria dianthicola umbra-like virus 2]
MFRCHTPCLPGVWRPLVHSPCHHNLAEGLRLRTMRAFAPPEPVGVKHFQQTIRLLGRVAFSRLGKVDRWSHQEVVDSYKVNRLRVRYQTACDSLRDDGLATPKDARVDAFVKAEKLTRYKVHKPRIIMGRAPRYNLELASYLKPLEHVLYPALRGYGSKYLTKTRLIGKGLNAKERASLIRTKLYSTPGLVAVEIDGVSFESHFSKAILAAEHDFYLRFYSGAERSRLQQLLSWQQEFRGSGEGLSFKASGVRASGDFNTGLGNTLVMLTLVQMVASRCPGRFDVLADGDNALLFVPEKHLDVWREQVVAVTATAGFEMTIEQPVSDLRRVVFGQSKPFFDGNSWKMVRDPMKVLSHAACGYRHYQDLHGGLRVLKSVAYCEAVLSAGVPVLQEYAHSLLRATAGVSFSKAEPEDYVYASLVAKGYDWAATRKLPVTARAREDFAVSFGISVEDQLRWEESLSKAITLPTVWPSPSVDVPDIRDVDTLPFDELGDPFE